MPRFIDFSFSLKQKCCTFYRCLFLNLFWNRAMILCCAHHCHSNTHTATYANMYTGGDQLCHWKIVLLNIVYLIIFKVYVSLFFKVYNILSQFSKNIYTLSRWITLCRHIWCGNINAYCSHSNGKWKYEHLSYSFKHTNSVGWLHFYLSTGRHGRFVGHCPDQMATS